MTNPSNLYAEKIFAEHPSALWALDDKIDYLSLLSEDKRDISDSSKWDIYGATAGLGLEVHDEPFTNSQVIKILGDSPIGGSGQSICISKTIINSSSLDKELGTFSIGGWFNSSSPYVIGFDIGYEYKPINSNTVVQKLKHYDSSISGSWIFISETFEIPSEDVDISIVVGINYVAGPTSTEDYIFYINGITLGQWSEEFNSVSLGTDKVNTPGTIYGTSIVPSTIYGDYTGRSGIKTFAYGLQDKEGYYIVSDNYLHAKNTGIPMVYGATNLTKLVPNSNGPSLIIPGLGFLNKDGQYNDYTLEAWVRINSDSIVSKRIIGPVASEDGVYVDGPFIVLKINDTFDSYYIGEWTRPMLLDFRVKNNMASLLINGEQVISISYTTSDLTLPAKSYNGKDQDWIGFYSYEDVSPVEIDCIAIYPYEVPTIVAKRRFVYGQGVEFPEGINQAYSGSSIYIDYPFADYTNNYSYPDIGNWSQGIVSNLSIQNNNLSTPTYSLPTITLESLSSELLYADNKKLNTDYSEPQPFFTFRPNINWLQKDGYLSFNDLNFLRDKIKSFYGVFKISELSSISQVLFHIESENTTNYFSITLDGNKINYRLKYNNSEEIIYTSYGILPNKQFSIALDFKVFPEYFGNSVAAFFGNPGSLKFYIGGKKELLLDPHKDIISSFVGNIYSIGFCNERNHLKVLNYFNEIGTSRDYENVFGTYNSGIGLDGGNDYFDGEGYAYNSLGQLEKIDPNPPTGFYNNWNAYVDGGLYSTEFSTKFQEHTASYTLVPSFQYGAYSLDIDINGYWEDHIPLTYFAQYVNDVNGDKYYDLDFIQFNINYPAPSIFSEEEQTGSWTYEELSSQYGNPVQRTYDSLDNQLYTGYANYDDLKNKVSKNYKYDTSNSVVRSYVTFQYVATGANAPEGYFTKTELAPKESVVEPGVDWINTKYEVINNMLIYPPKTADYSSLAMVTHLEFNVKNILKNKVVVKTVEYASQAFNDSSPNPIGTRFGSSIYPYKLSGYYYNYKDRNPFTIYKGSSPYLYLTRYSGIELKGKYDPLITRGLSIPINETSSTNYKVLAMQTAVRFDQDFFPYAPTEIFEIKSKNAHIKFFLVANHPTGKRAKIYAINALTGQLQNDIGFYWNGNFVKEPVITIKEWGFLGVYFPTLLDFKNTVGSININGPLMFNTISYYQSTNLQEVQDFNYRLWFSVKTAPPLPYLEWDYWKTAPYIWEGVLIKTQTSHYGVDPSTIYKSYTGTNKIIIDTQQTLTMQDYKYSIYSNIQWKQDTYTAL